MFGCLGLLARQLAVHEPGRTRDRALDLMATTLTDARAVAVDRPAERHSDWARVVPIASAIGLALVFTLDGYNIGRGNQIGQLPAILRLLDPGLLARDYFINAVLDEGPRYYYLRLLAFVGSFLPLPPVFFLLTVAANAATLLVTFRVTERLFDLSAAYASLALLCALQFYVPLGASGFLLMDLLTPATFAIPGMLAAIGAGLTAERNARAALYATLTSIIHPLYGLAAACAVALVALFDFAQKRRAGTLTRTRVVSALAPLGVFALAFLLLWHGKGETIRLDDATFFHIYGRLRAPHHLLPSRFPLAHWLLFAIFSSCSVAFLIAVRQRLRTSFTPLACLALLTLLGFVAGYVLVEVIPLRFMLVLQLYRFVCITTWVGIILAAGAASVLIHSWATPELPRWQRNLISFAFALLLLGDVLFEPQRRGVTLPVLALAALGAWGLHALRRRALGVAALAGVASFLALRLIVLADSELWLGNIRPAFVWSDYATRYDDIALFARDHTARDDVLLIADGATSQEAGIIRYKAGRALFADFKVFPLGNEMAEWYSRMMTLRELRPRANNDERLIELAWRYGLAYAVLPNTMPSKLPVVFGGASYFVVSLHDPAPL